MPRGDGWEPEEYRSGGRLVAAVGPDEERPESRYRAPRRLPGIARLPEGYAALASLRHRAAAGDETVLAELGAAECAWFAARWPEWRRPENVRR